MGFLDMILSKNMMDPERIKAIPKHKRVLGKRKQDRISLRFNVKMFNF